MPSGLAWMDFATVVPLSAGVSGRIVVLRHRHVILTSSTHIRYRSMSRRPTEYSNTCGSSTRPDRDLSGFPIEKRHAVPTSVGTGYGPGWTRDREIPRSSLTTIALPHFLSMSATSMSPGVNIPSAHHCSRVPCLKRPSGLHRTGDAPHLAPSLPGT